MMTTRATGSRQILSLRRILAVLAIAAVSLAIVRCAEYRMSFREFGSYGVVFAYALALIGYVRAWRGNSATPLVLGVIACLLVLFDADMWKLEFWTVHVDEVARYRWTAILHLAALSAFIIFPLLCIAWTPRPFERRSWIYLEAAVVIAATTTWIDMWFYVYMLTLKIA